MDHVEVKCKIDGVTRSFQRRDPCGESVESILKRKYPNAESRELVDPDAAWEAEPVNDQSPPEA